jgi:hypothetical protein
MVPVSFAFRGRNFVALFMRVTQFSALFPAGPAVTSFQVEYRPTGRSEDSGVLTTDQGAPDRRSGHHHLQP